MCVQPLCHINARTQNCKYKTARQFAATPASNLPTKCLRRCGLNIKCLWHGTLACCRAASCSGVACWRSSRPVHMQCSCVQRIQSERWSIRLHCISVHAWLQAKQQAVPLHTLLATTASAPAALSAHRQECHARGWFTTVAARARSTRLKSCIQQHCIFRTKTI